MWSLCNRLLYHPPPELQRQVLASQIGSDSLGSALRPRDHVLPVGGKRRTLCSKQRKAGGLLSHCRAEAPPRTGEWRRAPGTLEGGDLLSGGSSGSGFPFHVDTALVPKAGS